MLRRILRLAGRETRRPRFEAPGGTLALILFLLAVLLSLWGSGSGGRPAAERPSASAPPSPPALPTPVDRTPPVSPEPEPPVGIPEAPEADGCPEGCEEPLPDCDIKGNTSYRTGERIYHVPGQQNYDDTIIEPWKGERWFCTEDEAEANGWRKAKR